MSTSIVPDSKPSGKSNPGLTHLKSKHLLLAGWIEDTEHTLAVLQVWLDQLKRWQAQEQVSKREFEEACALLRRASLEEWAKMGLEKLQAAVTGEEMAGQS